MEFLSNKRIKKRIERDKARRKEKRDLKTVNTDDFSKIFTYQNYYKALSDCKKGVSYKRSVQEFSFNSVIEIYKIITTIEKGEMPKINNSKKVHIYERGKERIITPIRINDRITQKVTCDNSLVDIVQNHLIYDNGASTKGKGTDFARNRIFKMLVRAVKEYGSHFYVLKFDFKSFFDSIPHDMCEVVLNKFYDDKQIVDFIMGIIRSYPLKEAEKIEDDSEREQTIEYINNNKCKGICLGSQISQVMALAVPNSLDHFIKDKCSFKYYVRYMDDGIILFNNKEALQELLNKLKEIVDELGLKFNDKKTYITKSTKGFTFMKVRYYVTSSGKVIRKLDQKGATRMRRKLKKFKKLVDNGEMTLDDVYASMQSWLEHSKIAKSYHTRKNMLRLYDNLFDGYKLTKHWKRKQQKLSQNLSEAK